MSKQHEKGGLPAAKDWSQVFAQKLMEGGSLPPEKARPAINRRTAYHVYRSIGPRRSLAVLARVLNGPGWEGEVSVSQLQAWSKVEDWPRACAAWDAREAEAADFDELAALERLHGRAGALMHEFLDEEEEGPLATDTEVPKALMEIVFSLSERIGVLRRRRDAEALETAADHCDLHEDGVLALVASITSGSHDYRSVPEALEIPWPDGDALSDSIDESNCLPDQALGADEDREGVGQSWNVEEAGDDTNVSEETLADLVGYYLDDLPEEYANVLGPGDGQPLRIYVSKSSGFVVLQIYTTRKKWIHHRTDISYP